MYTILADPTSSKASFAVDGETPETVVSQLLTAIAAKCSIAAASVKQVHLDYTNLQGCGNACLEESLKVTCTSLLVILSAAAVLSDCHHDNHLVGVCRSVFCMLQKALAAIDVTYAPGTGPLKGIVACKGVDLPISSTAGQLWATELATLYQTAQDVAQERTRRYC